MAGGGLDLPLFDLDGDGVLQWSDRVVGGLAVSAGPTPAFDPTQPVTLSGAILGDSVIPKAVLSDSLGSSDLLVQWQLDGSENTAYLRIPELSGDLDVAPVPHFALAGQWHTEGIGDNLGLGRQQMLLSDGETMLIAELP